MRTLKGIRFTSDSADRFVDPHHTEPPFWYYPTRHSLGKALLRAGDAAGAEEVYRTDLKQYRRNGWSMYGLIQALKAQGKDSSDIQAILDNAWAQADVTLTASRF